LENRHLEHDIWKMKNIQNGLVEGAFRIWPSSKQLIVNVDNFKLEPFSK